MAAERVTAAERAGFDLAELARRVRELADLRGIEGPDRPIPEGEPGARLSLDRRADVLALAEMAEALAAVMTHSPVVGDRVAWDGEDGQTAFGTLLALDGPACVVRWEPSMVVQIELPVAHLRYAPANPYAPNRLIWGREL